MTTPVQIYLSSSDATHYLNDTSKSDMIFLFKSPVIPPPSYNMTLRLVNMYVPISFTIINSTNNTLILNGTTYQLDNGNYNATELATAIMTLVNSSEPSFTIEFSSITNKYTFSDVSDFTIGGSVSSILGLSGASSSTSNELTPPYPVDLTGQNIIYVDVKNITTFNLSSVSKSRTSIIGSVLVSVPYGSVLYYEDTSKTEFVVQEDSISFLHIRLCGEDQNTLLDLNNFNFSLTLEVGFTPKALQPSLPNTYKDVYTNYIKSLMENA